MSLVRGRGKALAFKHVAQVTSTVGAHNLGAHRKHGTVLVAHDGARDAVKVGRPATAAAEFVGGLVKGSVATGACVDALGRVVLVVLACAGHFGAFLAKDAELL